MPLSPGIKHFARVIDRGGAFANVKHPDFGGGAKGDWNNGTGAGTNDTLAIIAARDAVLAAGGKALYFPPGNYRVEPATDLSQVVLFGDGATLSGHTAVLAQIGQPGGLQDVQHYGTAGLYIGDKSTVNVGLRRLQAGSGIGLAQHADGQIVITNTAPESGAPGGASGVALPTRINVQDAGVAPVVSGGIITNATALFQAAVNLAGDRTGLVGPMGSKVIWAPRGYYRFDDSVWIFDQIQPVIEFEEGAVCAWNGPSFFATLSEYSTIFGALDAGYVAKPSTYIRPIFAFMSCERPRLEGMRFETSAYNPCDCIAQFALITGGTVARDHTGYRMIDCQLYGGGPGGLFFGARFEGVPSGGGVHYKISATTGKEDPAGGVQETKRTTDPSGNPITYMNQNLDLADFSGTGFADITRAAVTIEGDQSYGHKLRNLSFRGAASTPDAGVTYKRWMHFGVRALQGDFQAFGGAGGWSGTADFYVGESSHKVVIQQFKSEDSRRLLLTFAGNAALNVTVQDCRFDQNRISENGSVTQGAGDGNEIIGYYAAGTLTLIGNQFGGGNNGNRGKVVLGEWARGLNAHGNIFGTYRDGVNGASDVSPWQLEGGSLREKHVSVGSNDFVKSDSTLAQKHQLVGATPQVFQADWFFADDGVAVTNLLGGWRGKTVTIEGNGAKIISHNANIVLTGGANLTPGAGVPVRLYFNGTTWRQV